MIKRIHVNQHKIKSNARNGASEPVLSCKTSRTNQYGHECIIRGETGNEVARVIYRPHKPLSCGARCWVETKNPVEVVAYSSEAGPAQATLID